MSFISPLNAHSSSQSGVISKSHTPKPSPPLHANTPRGAAVSTGEGREEGTNGHTLAATETTDDSVEGSETREGDHLQLLITQQLTQQRRAAMAGLGKV